MANLTMSRARSIAKKYLQQANPIKWDGTGGRPDDVDYTEQEFNVNANTIVGIHLGYYEPAGWQHFCELKDKKTGDVIADGRGIGVNDVDTIAKTLVSMTPIYPKKG